MHTRFTVVVAAALLATACSQFASTTAPTPSVAVAEMTTPAVATPPAVPTAPAPAPAPPAAVPAPTSTARYSVTLWMTWSAATHPSDFPADAHFSQVVGGSHNSSIAFWRDGLLASPGIQAMAETGSKTRLEDEVAQAIAGGTAEHVISGNGISRSPGTLTFEIEVSLQFPLVTIVTMVAPSPDWFAGVSGLALLQDGAWRNDVSVDLFPWDAGTDSGVTFQSPDEESRPHVPVFRIGSFPFAYQGRVAPLGTMTFRRVQ